MSDARWIDVSDDVAAAVPHFERAAPSIEAAKRLVEQFPQDVERFRAIIDPDAD